METSVHVLTPSGTLDGTKTDAIKASAKAAIASGNKTLLIDLSETTFVDSSGLGTLVSVLKMARSEKCELAVCAVNPQVKMLFELTSMDQVFDIYEDRAAFEASRG